MKYWFSKFILVFLALIPVGSSGQRILGAESKSVEILDRAVPRWIVSVDRPFSSFAAKALGTSHTPGGVVLIDEDGDRTKLKISPSSLALHSVLDALVVADPRYRWQLSNEVVNITPVNGFPKVLDTVVARFDQENATAFEMLTALEVVPELRVRASKLGYSDIRLNKFEGFVSPDKFSVHCTNCSLREILNEIVRKHGSALWCYSETITGGEKTFHFWLLFS
jgi:hypothetical protein